MNRTFIPATQFLSFSDLAKNYRENADYRITCLPRDQSSTCIVAPHGGLIERHTSEIARAVAGDDFSLYLFEGIRSSDNYEALHLTSHLFDESKCLHLLSGCDDVVTIHGFHGHEEMVLMGGLDMVLREELEMAMKQAGIKYQSSGHQFPGRHVRNVCNRGRRQVGVQLEVSQQLRRSPKKFDLALAVRSVLLARGVVMSTPTDG